MAINPFNTIKVESPNSNQFDISMDNKLTLDMGKLYPVLMQDTLPGDTFSITPEMLIRFAPMLRPIMHRIDATIHFFYVPNRILWSNWGKFLANEDFVPPYIQGTNEEPFTVDAGDLSDYIGMPISTNIREQLPAFPWMAYARIFNEYYQDQNNDPNYENLRELLQTLSQTNGRVSPGTLEAGATNYQDALFLYRRAWEHDYFTSGLPFAQKGDAVNIPLQLAPLDVYSSLLVDPITQLPVLDIEQLWNQTGGLAQDVGGAEEQFLELFGITDNTGALTGTINEFRTAWKLQEWLELNARSGTRYNELMKAHFDVNIPDYTIQRPEYIGGIKNNIMISEVLQSVDLTIDGGSPLGDYAGHATGVVSGNTINYRCLEHGWVVGILSVMPKTAYFQGIHRKFTRMTNLDHYWSKFAHIGEQAVLSKELYYDEADGSANDAEFAYMPRYSEYKYNPSEIHGDFRTNMTDFHLARIFANRPQLNEEFIYCDPDKRIFAVTEEGVNSLYAHIYYNIRSSRKMPFFSNPAGL